MALIRISVATDVGPQELVSTAEKNIWTRRKENMKSQKKKLEKKKNKKLKAAKIETFRSFFKLK